MTREELAAYAAARHIPHVEDTTNADPGAAARNFLRLEVMPRLRQINPRAVEHINDAGRRLRVADQSLEEEAARRTAHVEVQEGRGDLIPQALAEATDAVRPRMLLRLFDLLGVGAEGYHSRPSEGHPAPDPGYPLGPGRAGWTCPRASPPGTAGSG